MSMRSIGQTAHEIADLLRIRELDLNESYQFWKSVSSALTGTYEAESAAAIAEALISVRYNREWDPEEYLDEETGFPTVAAYEEILDISLTVPSDQLNSTDWEESNTAEEIIQRDEMEEAGSDALATMIDGIDFDDAKVPVETLMRNIHAGRLVISPPWQRSYVWKATRKKRFIESLLLNLPIPPILTWHDKDTDKEYVIDGRQRLETLIRFCSTETELDKLGIKKTRPFRNFSSKQPLFADGAPLAEYANKLYSDFEGIGQKNLFDGKGLSKVRFTKISRSQLYQIFERYNTGGVMLQAQEIRNAIYQDAPLHKHLWNLAREYADPKPEPDADVERIAQGLRGTMDNGAARYGVYSFIGRVMAFTYFHYGRQTDQGFLKSYAASTANATLDFMEDYQDLGWDELRSRWVRMHDKALEWYTTDQFLVRTTPLKNRFHAFLATVQLVTTDHLLRAIEAKKAEERREAEERLIKVIRSEWRDFAINDPESGNANDDPDKPRGIAAGQGQQVGDFWKSQRDWLELLLDRGGFAAAS